MTLLHQRTPQDVATEGGHEHIAEYLQKAGKSVVSSNVTCILTNRRDFIYKSKLCGKLLNSHKSHFKD